MSQLTAAFASLAKATPPQRTPKLPAGTREAARDPHEREADRAAVRAATGSGGAPASSPSSGSGGDAPPPHALQILRRPGASLDASTRLAMNARLGHDFGRVQIHTDAEAAASARSAGALAYTVGAHVVFAAGRYAPHTHEGGHLLAHELAHVVQQSRLPAGAVKLQRKAPDKAAPSGKFYQEVVDSIAYANREMDEKRKQMGLSFPPINYDSLKLLLSLCEAVDQKALDLVPTRLDALLAKGLMVPFHTISEDLLAELSARIFEMGLESGAERLRKAYHEEEKSYSIASIDLGFSKRNVQFFTRLVDGAIESANGETPDGIQSSIHRFARAFVPLRDAYAAIDWEALRWEQQSRGGSMVLRPGMSREEWYRAVRGQIERWLGGIEALIQQTIDTARSSFENGGDGTALLQRLRDTMEKELREVLAPRDATKDISGEIFDITHTELTTKGKGYLSDAFEKDKKKRRVAITTYDPEQEWVQEMRTSLGMLYLKRLDQIAVLGRIYGAQDLIPRELGGAMNEEAAENAESISKLKGGRLRLDSDDDWREFVWQKYQDLTNPQPAQGGQQPRRLLKRTPGQALRAIMDVLYLYLRTFTMHAHYTNIYDIGDSYINKPFPRALSGQLLHDCGVYAVRVAYILSLVRDKLKLRIRFVFMPAHVALVIEGDGLPTFLAQNDSFVEVPPESMEAAKKNFEAFTRVETTVLSSEGGVTISAELPKHPPGKRDREQLLGELSAARYVNEGADMPFRVADIPGASTARGAEQALWRTYEAESRKSLFGPATADKKDPGYLFHQRYLGLIEERNKQYNSLLVPFWNATGPEAWGTLKEATAQTRGEATAATLVAPVSAYAKVITDSVKSLDDADKRIKDMARSITSSLQSNERLKTPQSRIAIGERGSSLFEENTELQDYRDTVNGVVAELRATPERSWKIDDLLKRLQPPFVPFSPRKRLAE